MSIRLGGIYALEKIAQDEPEAYFSQFREVLCAFVRERAQEPREPLYEEGEPKCLTRLAPDLQAVLAVVGRNPPPDEVGNPARIDWSGAHLEGAQLRNAYLEGAYLSETDLARANLIDAHLDEAIFYNTNLRDANLCGACLRKSHRLYTASLGGIRHDAETRFPEDLTLPRNSHYLFPSDDEEE